MAKFDESKVINALHTDKAEIGKKYYFSDELLDLKKNVEAEATHLKLEYIVKDVGCPFSLIDRHWQFLYPYEEQKQRMTNIQLMEWLSKGNGVYKNRNDYVYTCFSEIVELLDEEVDKDIVIRTWDSEEWVVPLFSIYERDCKGGKE